MDKENTQLMTILDHMIENPYMGLIYVDPEGKIIIVNQTFSNILGMDRDDILNKHITEVMPKSRLPQTLKTGETNLCELCKVKGKEIIAMRIPIYHEGKIIGAMSKSLFLDMSSAKVMARQITADNEIKTDETNFSHNAKYSFSNIIGSSNEIYYIKDLARQLAFNISNVLIVGETGTGKELLAQAIHSQGVRSSKPFVRVNCSCIPENLLESELFGYEEGAFTGARKGGKKGKFELAEGGTIFLDEIGDMPFSMQAKLLTILQEKEFERVGGDKTFFSDVRIIAATNIDLEEAVSLGKFREDLFYRLNVVTLMLPPLRHRQEDIPLLLNHFVEKINEKLSTSITGISEEAFNLLYNYDWPGNIREMENIIERATNLALFNKDSILKNEHFPTLLKSVPHLKTNINEEDSLNEAIEKLENQIILKTLKVCNHNKSLAAKKLDIHPSVLYRKLKKYNINY